MKGTRVKDVCHWIMHEGEKVFIPGCMGSINRGDCTCHRSRSIDDRIAELEEELRRLKRLKKQGACSPPDD